jgi:hypothetical protein
MKTMRVVLEIDVDDMSEKERWEIMNGGMTEDEVKTLADTSAGEIASVFDKLSGEVIGEMLFEGEDIFVKFTESRVIEAKWQEQAS